jgi:Nucleotidyl transferase AbiEii toxin, Type IV TA system
VTDRFTPFLELLPDPQKRLWPELRPASNLGFVLYRGTAIALRLGHRPSVDFDFFSDKPLDKSALQKALTFIPRSNVIQDQPDTFTILVPDSKVSSNHVKVSFFGNLDFGRVGQPQFTDDDVLQVASLGDLMATKLKVILQRIEAKDYRDIAAMLTAGVNLSDGLAAARAMYGKQFQPSESLKALVYFEGGDLYSLTDGEKQALIRAAAAVRELPRVAILSQELALPSSAKN